MAEKQNRELLIKRLRAQAANSSIMDVRDLIDMLVDDAMQKLTTADVPAIYKYQGKISALKDLSAKLSHIEE